MEEREGRLNLRGLKPEDAEALFGLWSDSEVIRFTNRELQQEKGETETLIKEWLKVQEKQGETDRYAVCLGERVIGTAGYPIIKMKPFSCGLFYQILRSEWGKGYGQKTAQILLDLLKEKHPSAKILADVAADNLASVKILRKLPFMEMEAERNGFERNGVTCDILHFEIHDNTTPMEAGEYDKKIDCTVPYYPDFYEQIQSVVAEYYPDWKKNGTGKWLDTGCGTGRMLEYMLDYFPGVSFCLCDISSEMIAVSQQKYGSEKRISFQVCSSQELKEEGQYDVVTAIQAHHYLSVEERKKAVEKCFAALKKGGLFLTFENVAPDTEKGKELGLKRWKHYQVEHGKPEVDAELHIRRYGVNYFPISVKKHIKLLKETGFEAAELFWYSYMQGGFYAVKKA